MNNLYFDIPAWTDDNERELLSQLAKEVPNSGRILEIGCLYGGTTAVLAKSNPDVLVTSMDNFSWTPEGYPEATIERFLDNMKSISAENVSVIKGDSTELWKDWSLPIDLLWIDGGHSYSYVYSDLTHFGKFAKVIALHDYDNPAWASIRRAVETFLGKNPKFYIDQIVGMVCVLRRK